MLTLLVVDVNCDCFYLENVCPNGNISYYFYTRETQNNPYLINIEDIRKTPFLPNKDLLIIIHGYTGNKDFDPNPQLRPAYFEHGEYNIISVDYGIAAQEPCYVHAAYNTEKVGRCTSQLLKGIYDLQIEGIHENTTHVVGFSLGAHVAGATGRHYYESHSTKLIRITGLDPAWPLFDPRITVVDNRLTKDNANFVDVVHTNSGTKGFVLALGHVDFYVNHGAAQPGCDKDASCDHLRAVLVFAESINSKDGFWASPCTVYDLTFSLGLAEWACLAMNPLGTLIDNEVLMGEHVDFNTRGTYLVKTNEAPPYAQGKRSERSFLEMIKNPLLRSIRGGL